MEDTQHAPLSLESRIEKQLECGLCLLFFYEPKVLSCDHIYCKSCADKLLRFHSDGSASIKCPLKCKVETLIDSDKTSSDLKVNLYIQGIIDMISEEYYGDSKGDKRCNEEKCDGSVSAFCYSCSCLLCTPCCNKHENMHENKFVSIKFDEREESLVAMCDEHKTSVEFVCLEEKCKGKFLCLYCVGRNHNNHHKERIGVKCARIKQRLESEKEGMDNIEDSVQKINEMLVKDEKSMSDTHRSLDCILKQRIANGLTQYIKRAQAEKTEVLNEFAIAASIHKQSYPETDMDKFFNKFNKLEDVLVVLMEKNAISCLDKLASAKINLPTVNIGLTDPTTSKALGNLKVQAGPRRSINVGNNDANFTNSLSGCDENCNVSDLWEAIEEIVGKRDVDTVNSVVSENKNCSELKIKQLGNSIPDKDETQCGKASDADNSSTEMIIKYKFLLHNMSVFIGILSIVVGIIAVVVIGSYKRPIDGAYSEWSEFSSCSASCGKGLKTRERFCDNPLPRHGGAPCSVLGVDKETKQCNIVPCHHPTIELGNQEYKLSYSEYNATFEGFGIGLLAHDRDACIESNRLSSLVACIEHCAIKKLVDNDINGVRFSHYYRDRCCCESNYTTHKYNNAYVHYKLT